MKTNIKIFTVLMLTTIPCFAAQEEIQKAKDKIQAAINAGVTQGSKINVGKYTTEPEVAALLEKWEKACKNAKVEGAKLESVFSIGSTYGRICAIKSCDKLKGYELSEDKKSCIKKTPEQKKPEEKQATTPVPATAATPNAVASGSPRTNVNSVVTSDAGKQAQESNNPSRIPSANRGLTVSGGPTVNTSGLKSTAPEKTNKDFSAQQACNIEGGTWNDNTCTCPEENEGWDSTRQICSVDAKLTTLTTDTSAPDAVNAADVKIKGPANTTSKEDLDKNQKALNKELKEQDCANKNGRWDGVTCWCGAKVQSLDEKATACPTKEEKQAAKAQTKLEKDFVADVKKLTDAFNKKVKALTKDKK